MTSGEGRISYRKFYLIKIAFSIHQKSPLKKKTTTEKQAIDRGQILENLQPLKDKHLGL